MNEYQIKSAARETKVCDTRKKWNDESGHCRALVARRPEAIEHSLVFVAWSWTMFKIDTHPVVTETSNVCILLCNNSCL